LLGRTRQRHRDPGHTTPQLVCRPRYHTKYRTSTQLSTSYVRYRHRHVAADIARAD
jgi:hypothetical protein